MADAHFETISVFYNICMWKDIVLSPETKNFYLYKSKTFAENRSDFQGDWS